MAFFGITHLGYQDPIREHVVDTGKTPQYIFQSGLYREPPYRLPPIKDSIFPLPGLPTTDVSLPSECREQPVYSTGYAGTDISYSDLKMRIDLQKYKHGK